MLGGLTLTGRFVKLANVNKFAERFLHLGNLFEMVQGIGLGSGSLKPTMTAKQLAEFGWSLDFLRTLTKDVGGIWPFAVELRNSITGSGMQPADTNVTQPTAASATSRTDASTNTSADTSANPPADTSANPPAEASANPPAEASANPPAEASADPPVADVPAPLLDTGEPIETLLLCLNMALNITNMTYQIVETVYADLWLKDTRDISQGEDTQYTSAEKAMFRNKLYLSAIVIDHGIIDVALGVAMAISMAKGIPGSSAEIRMRPSGDLVLKGARYQKLYGIEGSSDSTSPLFYSKAAMAGINTATATIKLAADVAKWAATGPATVQRVKPWLEKL
jgi:hypothetical protein